MTMPPASAPPPHVATATKRTLFLRTFIPWQLWRFVVINLRMIGIIFSSHK